MEKDKTDFLLEILKTLSEKYDPDESILSLTYKELKDVYSDEDFRHSYAVLSVFSEKLTPDSREELVANIDCILLYADKNFKASDKNIIKRIGKLADHLELENIRLSRIEQIKLIAQNVTLEKKSIEVLINDNKRQIIKQQKSIDNINVQTISVLGIFSAIVIAFFGGMSYFSSVFSNINESPIYVSLAIASILGIVIINTIYLLLKYMLVIIQKERLLYGGRVYVVINVLLVITLIMSIIMWMFDFRPETMHI